MKIAAAVSRRVGRRSADDAVAGFGRNGHNMGIRAFSTGQSTATTSSSDWTHKYNKSPHNYVAPRKSKRDVIIIGGGHNGLVTAAYLAKAGLDVVVLERRHILGGAAVTEEIEPGFKYSRASYLAGLLRPQIIQDLSLEKYGFKYIPRDPSSFTPTKPGSRYDGKYLMLGSDEHANWESIAQFSKKDADAYPKYEEFLGQIRDIMQPILDSPPMDLTEGTWAQKRATLRSMEALAREVIKNRKILVPFYELMVGPAEQILNRWFESDILKTTLATDAVIGAMCSPKSLGSAYVLLHHVMGEAAGKKGVWAYVEGGMGAVSEAIAASARSYGAETVVNALVKSIRFEKGRAVGVTMEDGSVLSADTIISGTSPFHTFTELCSDQEQSLFPKDFITHIKHTGRINQLSKINRSILLT
jgi:phytoene dehydrogenase-like protein